MNSCTAAVTPGEGARSRRRVGVPEAGGTGSPDDVDARGSPAGKVIEEPEADGVVPGPEAPAGKGGVAAAGRAAGGADWSGSWAAVPAAADSVEDMAPTEVEIEAVPVDVDILTRSRSPVQRRGARRLNNL